MAPVRILWLTIGIGSALFLLAILKDTTPSQWVSTVVGYVTYPLLVMQAKVQDARERVTSYNNSYAELQQQVSSLQQQVQDLTLENHRLLMVSQYHDDIAQLAAFAKSLVPAQGQVCQVLLRHLARDRQYFVVQGGSRQGIHEGMVALVDQHLIGSVTQVMPSYCTVTLLTDKATSIAAYCVGTRSAGILGGDNQLDYCYLRFVDHLASITIGDTVVSSGEGLLFPRGFLLGTIIQDTIEGVYHIIKVKPSVALETVHYCVLVDPANMVPLEFFAQADGTVAKKLL